MIAPKRRLTNHALHGREEWFKRIFRDQIAEAAGILEVVLITRRSQVQVLSPQPTKAR